LKEGVFLYISKSEGYTRVRGVLSAITLVCGRITQFNFRRWMPLITLI